jgi:hypothetical protein
MATNNMVDVYGTSSHKQQCRLHYYTITLYYKFKKNVIRVPQFLKSGSCNSQSVSGKIYSVNESRGRKDRLESQIIVARATTTKVKEMAMNWMTKSVTMKNM